MSRGPTWRTAALRSLASELFDVLVVGGGATGAAIARDAALRGVKVALCERGDFAAETSGHSSRLIHGGIRYLEQGQLPLVFEALAERARLMRAAPHLCRPVEFLFPAYRGDDPSLRKLSAGVALYDALALWRPPTHSRRLAAGELYRLAPLLRTAGLQGALAYVDCQTDDARLVLETVLDAELAGATVASYVEVAPPRGRRRHLFHVLATDRDSGDRFVIQARAVVNATGPFSDAFRGTGRALRPTLGVHVVLPSDRLPTDGRAFALRSPRDRRVMFTLPAGTRTVVGTTDTDWRPSGEDRPPRPGDPIQASAADVEYLIEAARDWFPAAAVGPDDVISTFAGLRPLLASDAARPSQSSREHAIWIDGSGVLTVAGGKLTTMRRMGEETVDRLAELLRDRGYDRRLAPCTTRDRPLPGAGHAPGAPAGAADAVAEEMQRHLAQTYGGRAGQLLELVHADPALGRRLVPELPSLRAEVLFAVRADHAAEVEDVLRRRLLLFRDARDQGLGAAPAVADVLAQELGWSQARRDRSLTEYHRAVTLTRRWREASGSSS